MDFSSVTRAIESLNRRNPPLNDEIIKPCQELLMNHKLENDASIVLSTIQFLIATADDVDNNNNINVTTTSSSSSGGDGEGKVAEEDVTSSGIRTKTGIRWEPLAVGLFIATELIHQQKQFFGDGKQQQQQDGSWTNFAVSDQSNDTTAATTATTIGEEDADLDDNNNDHGIVYVDGPRVPNMVPSEAVAPTKLPTVSVDQLVMLCQILYNASIQHLEHREPRVRTLIAKTIGAYAKVSKVVVALATNNNNTTINNTLQEYVREMHTRLTQSIHEHIVSGRDENGNYSRTTQGALDDTTGWRALETNWLALASMISSLSGQYLVLFCGDGTGSTSSSFNEILQDCEFSSIRHINRHVRAAAMACLEQIIRSCSVASKQGTSTNLVNELLMNTTGIVRTTTISVLRAGLADNWSQVRMAGSVLCRVFLLTLGELGSSPDQDVYPTILPRMCLNRFYLAQGVKLYSHESWKIIFHNSSGLPKLVENLPAVCRYYVKMCDADNHAVREAACQAIAELAVRLGQREEFNTQLKSHIDMLLQALLMCFHDESWPVRDEACLACGIICKAYPEECRPELKLLWDRWTEQLTDQIWSVREDAAVALGDAVLAYGPEMLDKVRDLIQKILPAAKDQPAMTREQYKAHVNDIEAHTDSQLYSCGSLAPKLRKGGAGRIGCSSCGIDRPKAPWEATDGCIYLLREICQKCYPPSDGSKLVRDDVALSDEEVKAWLKQLADVCRVQHFPQSDDLRTTLWRNVPVIAFAIGKEKFKKQYLDIFMDLLFSNLESRTASQLSRHAAGQCAEELASLVGKAIFRGRLEDYQQEIFDNTMRERQMMPKGPADSFSPFGPPDLLDSVMGKRPNKV